MEEGPNCLNVMSKKRKIYRVKQLYCFNILWINKKLKLKKKIFPGNKKNYEKI